MAAAQTLLAIRPIEAFTPGARDRFLWDTEIKGFGLKVTPAGAKTFLLVYRFPRGREGRVRRFTIGSYGDITVKQARDIAETKKADLKRGIDPMAALQTERKAAKALKLAPKRSVEAIVKEFVERYAKRRNRSWEETQRILNRHIVPAWGSKQIGEVTRADINALLDSIEDQSGAPMASAVLAQLRKMMNWHATRDDAFNTPIVRGMGRHQATKRTRILTDDEIRIMWQALDAATPPYRQLVRTLLLTAQRRDEVAGAPRTEFGSDGGADLWSIPAERYKTKRPHLVPLTAAAMKQIADLGDLGKLGDFQFTTTGDKPFSGFSKCKGRLDVEMERILRKRAKAAGQKVKGSLLKQWQLHDLRRTAKTLMQRAGVRPDISERVLGHTIKGVEGTYDLHAYLAEKRHALTVLATEIERIVKDDGASNVVPIRSSA